MGLQGQTKVECTLPRLLTEWDSLFVAAYSTKSATTYKYIYTFYKQKSEKGLTIVNIIPHVYQRSSGLQELIETFVKALQLGFHLLIKSALFISVCNSVYPFNSQKRKAKRKKKLLRPIFVLFPGHQSEFIRVWGRLVFTFSV